MIHTDRRSAGMERCPYLGLHDDSSTSLGFPSEWNYCYRAAPPASVLVTHQTETCLCPSYVDCTVYRANKWERLPSNLRGKVKAQLRENRSATTRRWLTLLFFLILLALLAVFLSQRFFSPTQDNAGFLIDALSIRPAGTNSLDPTGELIANGMTQETPFSTESLTGVSNLVVSGVIGTSQAVPTSNKTPQITDLPFTPSLGLAPTSIPEGTCGHALDTPFGKKIKFLIHRVARGENLTLYARQYETSTNAILAINYQLPMPVWEDWMIVIPVKTLDVSELPPFEPYQAIGTRLSLSELARQLNTDAQSLYSYNAFEGPCKLFSGWLLVPRTPVDA